MIGGILFGVIFVWVVTIQAGWVVGNAKGRAGQGLALCFLLGIYGLFIIYVLPEAAERQATYVKELARLQNSNAQRKSTDLL